MKHFLAVTAIVLSGIGGLQASVLDEAKGLMDKGEFKKAESLICSSSGISAFQADSLAEIMNRIRNDFRITYAEGAAKIQELYANASMENIEDWEYRNYIETKVIDGEKYMFRKSLTNLDRLVPELSAQKRSLQIANDNMRAEFAREVMAEATGTTGIGSGRRITLKFTIDVEPDAVPAGEMMRVWMPFPIESARQKNITLISSSDDVVYSIGSVHRTIYMEREAKKGEAAHFEAVFSYDVYPQFLSQKYLLDNLQRYDKSSAVYKQYTSEEAPQILLTDKMRSLAERIVGNETNPVKQAGLVFDWIDVYFPWAGAREYSTIPNLAEYALERGYGDCGQVSLLYITLLRSLGIPAKWESGWSLEPGKAGMHDWAEVYFEGIGWIPCDMSYGLLETNDDQVLDFYKSGIDYYRFAANCGVNGQLCPQKNFIRSETVDSQLGEVEWSGGNLFYYKEWTPKMEILGMEILPFE